MTNPSRESLGSLSQRVESSQADPDCSISDYSAVTSCDCFEFCVQSYHGGLRGRVWKRLRMAESDRADTHLHHAANSQV